VDLSAPPAPADGTAAAATTPPAPNLKATDIELIIRNALGLKETDAIKVIETPFRRAQPSETAAAEETSTESRTFYLDVARHASLGVLVIGALVALKIVSGPRKKGAGMPVGALAAPSTGGAGGLPMLGGGAEENPAVLKSRITAALQENPEEVKRLFTAWAEGRQEG
jgi:flagellar biosynthesis/type III secretory pathway M-ring protein FliF/YscJ